MRRRNRASDFGGSGLVDGDSWRAMLEDDASSHEIVGAVRVVVSDAAHEPACVVHIGDEAELTLPNPDLAARALGDATHARLRWEVRSDEDDDEDEDEDDGEDDGEERGEDNGEPRGECHGQGDDQRARGEEDEGVRREGEGEGGGASTLEMSGVITRVYVDAVLASCGGLMVRLPLPRSSTPLLAPIASFPPTPSPRDGSRGRRRRTAMRSGSRVLLWCTPTPASCAPAPSAAPSRAATRGARRRAA